MMLKTNEIYLGDAYKLIKEIDDKSIDCIYTDIPYLYDKHGFGKSPLSQRKGQIDKELTGITEGIDFSIFSDFKRVLKKTNLFIWCSKLQIKDILNYFASDSVRYEILVWCKTNPVPATYNTWLPDIEYCLYFREAGVRLAQDSEFKHKYFLSSVNKSDKFFYEHPTIKPLEFVRKNILHSTSKNEIVLDPFAGSGTTLVACKETGREYIGFEIDKHYYEIASDRLNGISQFEKRNGFEQLKLW